MTQEDLKVSLDEDGDSLSWRERQTDGEEIRLSEKLILVKQILEKIQLDLSKAFKVLADSDQTRAKSQAAVVKKAGEVGSITQEGEAKIIEGVFDGQNMIGPDGKQYSVPSNYASKSKLVEGDIMKLTIQPNGTFVYKQIGPRERDRLKGILTKDGERGDFQVLAEGRRYRVLLASVTYFKGEAGDEAVILVPKEKNSSWAAVENIVKAVNVSGPGSGTEDFNLGNEELEIN